jgi:hypothetical protein
MAVASVAATVPLLSGKTQASFTIQTAPLTTQTTVTITASCGGTVKTLVLTINPPVLSYLNDYTYLTTGGNSVSMGFGLTGAAAANLAVSLNSSNQGVAAVPATAAVAVGKAQGGFIIQTTPVTIQTVVIITASLGGVSKTLTLTVTPPVLSYFSSYSLTIAGGNAASMAFGLTGTAAANLVVSLSSSNPAVASVPATAPVTAGKVQGGFTIQTARVTTPTVVTITASCGGVAKILTVTVNPR